MEQKNSMPEMPKNCPYGCGVKIAKRRIEIKLTGNKTKEIELYYEKIDGDFTTIHMCNEFQKLLDWEDSFVWKTIENETQESLRVNKTIDNLFPDEMGESYLVWSFDERFNDVNEDEKEKQLREVFGSKIKKEEMYNAFDNLALFDEICMEMEYNLEGLSVAEPDIIDNYDLETTLYEMLEGTLCYNIYWPLIEIGNLLNVRGEFNAAIQIFNIILQWNRFEPISNLGKAEAMLHLGIDEKSVANLLFDCKNKLKPAIDANKKELDAYFDKDSMLTSHDHPNFGVNLAFGNYNSYDEIFFSSKVDYLLAIIDIRWGRPGNAKKLIESAINEIEKYFLGFWFEKKDLENKIISSETIARETGELGTISPEIQLLRELLDLYTELGTNEGMGEVADKAWNLNVKYKNLSTKSEERLKKLSKQLDDDLAKLEKSVGGPDFIAKSLEKDKPDLIGEIKVNWEKMLENEIDRQNIEFDDKGWRQRKIEEIPTFDELEYDKQKRRDHYEKELGKERNYWRDWKLAWSEKDTRSRLSAYEELRTWLTKVKPESSKAADIDLKEDIKKRGLIEPILISPNGKIIDGHRRMRICKELGIKPKFETIFPKENKNLSPARIPTKKLSENEMMFEIEKAFRKLIKRKLSGFQNWERELIPEEVFQEANRRWEEEQISHRLEGEPEWLDFLDITGFKEIFLFHCKTCIIEKKRLRHNKKICNKSNWELFFRRVFGGKFTIFQGEIDSYRDIRNTGIAHTSGRLSEVSHDELVLLFSKWNKMICNDEDKSEFT